MPGRRLLRVQPGRPIRDMKTYAVRSPIQTHTRPATCEEADCPHWREGWDTVVDEATDLGMGQAAYIRAEMLSEDAPAQPGDPRRRYREFRDELGRTVFRFGPGQPCFRSGEHRVTLDRPELYVVRGGDWRAHTGVIRQHTRPDDWVDDFADHQDRLKTLHERG